MKKFKSLVYMLALALIFVGAASVTKASAADTGCTVTITATGAEAIATYDVDGTPTEITAEIKVPADETVTVKYAPTDGNDKVEIKAVAADKSTVDFSDPQATQDGKLQITFTMPGQDVTITMTGSKTTQESPTDPGEEDNKPTTSEKIDPAKCVIEYNNEWIVVESGSQVYYQVLKTAGQTVKPANWIKAAKGTGENYYIDFSATSNTKDVIIGVTNDNTLTAAQAEKTVETYVKSAKITLDYAVEEVNSLDDVIAGIKMKSTKSGKDDQEGKNTYTYVWKRGAAGSWKAADEFKTRDWDMMKAANSTLYISVTEVQEKEANEAVAYRYSKETKVKIPKTAKAPTIKVDYVKGTIGIKNGMQIKLDDGEWVTIPYYNKNDGKLDDKTVFYDDFFNSNDPQGNAYTVLTKTKAKVSNVTIAALIDEFDMDNKGTKYEFEVRTLATDKKFPSAITQLSLVTPANAPELKDVAKENKVVKYEYEEGGNFIVKFGDLIVDDSITEKEYEYMFVKLEGEQKINFNSKDQKWVQLKAADLTVKPAAKVKVCIGDAAATQVEHKDCNYLYIRKAAVKTTKSGTTVIEGTFASDYAIVKIEVAQKETAEEVEGKTISWTGTATAVTYKVGDAEAVNVESGKTAVPKDAKVTVTVADGATVTGIDGTLAGTTFTFTMPDAAVTLTITAPQSQPTGKTISWTGDATVTYKVGEADAVSVTSADTPVPENAKVTVTVADGATVTGIDGTLDGTTFTFTMPNAAVTLTITAPQSQPTGKTISWTGDATVTYKVGEADAVSVTSADTPVPENATVTVTVADGATVTGIEGTLSGTTFTFTMPNEAVELTITAPAGQ